MSDDTLACFQSLLKDVPTWIADLEAILKDVNRKQAEFLSRQLPIEATLSRRSSLTSLHSNSPADELLSPQVASTDPTLLRQQMPYMTQEDQLRLAQRKRKTASVCSHAPLHPSKYRSRSMVVVYYDGDTQKAFENVVRAVGSSRNNIRKGKLGARLDSLSRSDSLSSCNSSAGEETIKGLGTFTYRTTTTHHRSGGRGNSVEAFDRVDSALETAQNHCERAAHQILRDGDCEDEITKANQQFKTSLDLVEAELPAMLKRAEKIAKRQKDPKLEAPIMATAIVAADFSCISSDGVLEVDTDEGSGDSDNDGEFQVSTIKLPPHLNKFSASRAAPVRVPC